MNNANDIGTVVNRFPFTCNSRILCIVPLNSSAGRWLRFELDKSRYSIVLSEPNASTVDESVSSNGLNANDNHFSDLVCSNRLLCRVLI